MLAKQVWRILTNPDLLLTRILRSRYFPTGDIWTAELGPRPSATWRSLVVARPFVRTGSRMRIGDGTTMSIWGNHSLMVNGNGQIFTKRPSHSFPNTVSDLIKTGTRTWNMNMIKDTFWPIDQARILAVPIGGCNVKDRIIWHLSNTGKFTVKSCYHAIHASLPLLVIVWRVVRIRIVTSAKRCGEWYGT
ncbi:PREDICTED: uncharacterized protein LOC105963619 [Erythranthe guttata]|uniref:uncharacterized protein LOC105963619 n=1 Tax=Erythranthe guttata TaxID=4155 RepID=UPI00064D7E55|nr:PREDICTED: uncharacterized protein LOC105963619 [Erythranthe guttata]|eukprot:XP_012843491.1 PREDICTED: uncharacterized protein LOC105963619 [Erythranthe guttata]